MAEEIFEGTPLPGYSGKTQTAEDWGIEGGDSDNELHINPDSFYEAHGEEAPSVVHESARHLSREDEYMGTNRQLRPLILRTGVSFTRREQFRQTLKALLGQKVSMTETSRFLDQFRYIIVSSGLLEPHPLYNVWSTPVDLRRQRLLFDHRKPWVHLYVEPVYRATERGSIVVLCVLLHYKYRGSSTKSDRTTVAIVITIAIVVYMFATSRRRLLRSLRERALVYMEMFSQSSKYLDGDCVRALRQLQDLDFAAQGFAPGSRHNFLVANTRIVGKKLRAVLANSLHLIKEAYLDAFKDCICMGQRVVLEQFFEIYDLNSQMTEHGFVISDEFIGFMESASPLFSGPEACHIPVRDLKRELEKVHLLRRALLCCLLAAESTGETSADELERWTIICDNLLNANNLTEQLSILITKERLQPATESVRHEEPKAAHPQHQQRLNRTLVDALARAKYLSARLDLVHESELPEHELRTHIEAVEREIEDLSQKWKTYLAVQGAEYNPNRKEGSNGGTRANNTDVSPTPTLVMTPESSEISTFGALSVPELSDVTSEAATEETLNQLSVLEGEAPPLMLAKSGLSREERISIAKRDRVISSSSLGSRKGSLMLELNSVLSRGELPRG